MNRVRAIEMFDGSTITDLKLVIETADFSELIVHPFIGADAIVVSTFHHEGARGDEGGHFRIVEGAAEVPIPDLILAGVNVTHRHVRADTLAHPLIEIPTANAQTVIREHRRCAHGAFATITQPIKCNLIRLSKGLHLQPFKDALMLAVDDGVKCKTERVEFALQGAEGILAAIGIMRSKGDESLFRQAQRKGLV